MNPPITPGEILLEEYLTPMGISQNAMARAIGVAPRAINEIIFGHRAITSVMSIRFGAFFRQPPSSGTGCRSIAIFGHWAKCKKAHRQNPSRPKPRTRRATRLTVKSSHMTPSGFPCPRPAFPHDPFRLTNQIRDQVVREFEL